MPDDNKWDNFVEKCLTSCINLNKEHKDIVYMMSYDYDEIELSTNKLLSGGIPSQLKTITLCKEDYMDSNKTDKDILDSLLNTIQSDSTLS